MLEEPRLKSDSTGLKIKSTLSSAHFPISTGVDYGNQKKSIRLQQMGRVWTQKNPREVKSWPIFDFNYNLLF